MNVFIFIHGWWGNFSTKLPREEYIWLKSRWRNMPDSWGMSEFRGKAKDLSVCMKIASFLVFLPPIVSRNEWNSD